MLCGNFILTDFNHFFFFIFLWSHFYCNITIYEYFGDENPFMDYKKEVGDFKLNMSAERPESTDVENAKILYFALKDLDNSQASDERLWVGLAHNQLWEFMNYRCKLTDSKISVDSIKSNFFFKQNPRSAIIVNAIARLWWVGRLTYNANNKDDPFYAIKYFETDFSTKVRTLFSSSFTNNSKITLALIKAIIDIETENGKISRQEYQSLLRYLNMIGGIFVLYYLSEDEIRDKLVKYYDTSIRPNYQKGIDYCLICGHSEVMLKLN